jgi:dTDP-4-amino-4,6-dideoxygalactose transaminase
LADFVRKARNYGDDGTNNFVVQGLSARLSEFHAAIALRSFAKLPKNLALRHKKAAYLTSHLKKIEPRLKFQLVPPDTTTTHYIFSIYIDPAKLGYTRDQLFDFFAFCKIASRKYFHPTLHKQTLFKRFAPKGSTLPVTEDVSARVLSLPLYSHMAKSDIDRVLAAFTAFSKQYQK